MQEIRNEWKDRTYTLAATIVQQQMVFNHNGQSVAHIDKDGNLHIKGEVIELKDPKGLVLVHANTDAFQIWPNPHVMYNGKDMTALLVHDLNTMNGLQYPACFWDDKDFYVWGELGKEIDPANSNAMLTMSPFELEGFGLYNKTSIRGTVIKENTDEPSAQAE